MSSSKKTIRLIIPQWQGGENPDYAFGAEVLAFIAPPSKTDETIRVAIDEDFARPLQVENGIAGERVLLKQLDETTSILAIKNPDRVIAFGGDCSISQAPFDYLSGKYGEHLGVLWFDAHPDIASPQDSTHNHEMVLGNIIGRGAPQFAVQMKHPIDACHVMYAGLIKHALRPKDRAVHALGMNITSPCDLTADSGPIIRWIQENEITSLAVHFDLDVLSPADFRSIFPAKPYQRIEDFGAAVGELTLPQFVRILQDASGHAEIVGFCIAEHMPWDAMNLRAALSRIPIFGD